MDLLATGYSADPRCPTTGFPRVICVCAWCRPDLTELMANSVCSCGEKES